ncbi:uncharacterized protein BDR25DRAFT_378407 [Lindgomyces ingoldianus]|uniref:Uncharacterized protein n=1 Tax=Lindgomyces ingoldianus TaxID=673940 RepID=A0ACB6QGR0_9PLEO|nr:uncharacterized protein BDR25DRAFT_378407 [Lindgomyces ingoldianus]KAF2465743.1 hypothetical protein BDR25DRAFT_378407 [Lindgomyces ingoldianus]
MPSSFSIPRTIDLLRGKANEPFELGRTSGELMEVIPTLVMMHLGHAITYRNNSQKTSINTEEFAAAIDAKLEEMRTMDAVVEPFPNALSCTDRKARKRVRRYRGWYTQALVQCLEKCLAEQLRDVFEKFSNEENQQFNKGFDYGLNRLAYRLYPEANVALEAKGENWSQWLKSRTDDLARVAMKQGHAIFEDW